MHLKKKTSFATQPTHPHRMPGTTQRVTPFTLGVSAFLPKPTPFQWAGCRCEPGAARSSRINTSQYRVNHCDSLRCTLPCSNSIHGVICQDTKMHLEKHWQSISFLGIQTIYVRIYENIRRKLIQNISMIRRTAQMVSDPAIPGPGPPHVLFSTSRKQDEWEEAAQNVTKSSNANAKIRLWTISSSLCASLCAISENLSIILHGVNLMLIFWYLLYSFAKYFTQSKFKTAQLKQLPTPMSWALPSRFRPRTSPFKGIRPKQNVEPFRKVRAFDKSRWLGKGYCWCGVETLCGNCIPQGALWWPMFEKFWELFTTFCSALQGDLPQVSGCAHCLHMEKKSKQNTFWCLILHNDKASPKTILVWICFPLFYSVIFSAFLAIPHFHSWQSPSSNFRLSMFAWSIAARACRSDSAFLGRAMQEINHMAPESATMSTHSETVFQAKSHNWLRTLYVDHKKNKVNLYIYLY